VTAQGVNGPRVAAIAVSDLRKSYGSLEAVKGVSFEVAPGEVFALLGPNGAGKTTTVEILEGYRPRDGGSVSRYSHVDRIVVPIAQPSAAYHR